MAYPQAPAEMPLYMRLPQGCKREGTTRKHTCPQIGAQHLWAKAGRSCMEQIYGPGHEGDRFQAQCLCDRIPSTTPGAEPPRGARDSGSARSHSTHLETSSSNQP